MQEWIEDIAPGFEIPEIARVDDFSDTGAVVRILCGGARDKAVISRRELESSVDGGALLRSRILETTERMWSRWLAL